MTRSAMVFVLTSRSPKRRPEPERGTALEALREVVAMTAFPTGGAGRPVRSSYGARRHTG
jgi:hypothetical protein